MEQRSRKSREERQDRSSRAPWPATVACVGVGGNPCSERLSEVTQIRHPATVPPPGVGEVGEVGVKPETSYLKGEDLTAEKRGFTESRPPRPPCPPGPPDRVGRPSHPPGRTGR